MKFKWSMITLVSIESAWMKDALMSLFGFQSDVNVSHLFEDEFRVNTYHL